MADKKSETRFTIQFSHTDPSHLQVAEILNRQGRRSKAQYIVNAVLHYESCSETPNMPRTAELDVKVIEAVVNRILMEREKESPVNEPKTAYSPGMTTPKPEGIIFDDALENLGPDGVSAIADVLNSFRNR